MRSGAPPGGGWNAWDSGRTYLQIDAGSSNRNREG